MHFKIFYYNLYWTINIKKIAFGNKEHTTDSKMGISVLLRLFISSNKFAILLSSSSEQNSIFKYTTMGPMVPKEMKYKSALWDIRTGRRSTAATRH